MNATLQPSLDTTSTLTTRIEHPETLHMRPCAAIVDHLSSLEAEVEFVAAQERTDGTSLLDLLCLAASCEAPLVIHATGRDAVAAIEGIRAIVGMQ